MGGSSLAVGQIASPDTAAPSSHQEEKFYISEYRVIGNTVLDTKSVEESIYSFLGEDRTFKDIEAARAALETRYHDLGYGTVFVDIPEQSIDAEGVVRLRVTEARLRNSSVSGARYFSDRQIRDSVPAAQPGTVPNLPVLQAQINTVNAVTRDRTVVPVLKAGPVPGTVDLSLKVQDELPFHGSLELNNQYTPGTSSLRALGVLSYDNAFRRFDSVSVQYQTSPQDRSEVDVWAAAYIARLDESGDRLALTYVHSSSSVATVGALGVLGKGQTYSARFVKPLSSSAAVSSQVSVGLDYKDFSQDVVVSQSSSLSTPISYASLSASYNWSWRRPQQVWSWSPSLVLGIPGIGSSREEFADKCFRCSPNFSALRMDASLRQEIVLGFVGLAQLSGQYSVDPVISNEQFLIGGAHSVRGYLEAEDLGDIGVRGTLELHAQNYLPKFTHLAAEPFAFFDAGRISYQQPLPGQASSAALRSWGLGTEWSAWQWLEGSLTWATPLVDGGHTRRHDSRWEFVIRSSW